jgi:hypothetical protein
VGRARRATATTEEEPTTEEETEKEEGSEEVATPEEGDTTEQEEVPTGDVDVADVKPTHVEGEYPPIIPVGAWVRVRAEKDNGVPVEYDGQIAEVIESPTFEDDCDWSPRKPHQHQDPDGDFLVRLRGEGSPAILRVKHEAFSGVSIEGRAPVASFG